MDKYLEHILAEFRKKKLLKLLKTSLKEFMIQSLENKQKIVKKNLKVGTLGDISKTILERIFEMILQKFLKESFKDRSVNVSLEEFLLLSLKKCMSKLEKFQEE